MGINSSFGLKVKKEHAENIGKFNAQKQKSHLPSSRLAGAVRTPITNLPNPDRSWMETHWINGDKKPPEFEFHPRLGGGLAAKLLGAATVFSAASIGMDPKSFLPGRVPLFGGGSSYEGGTASGKAEDGSTNQRADRAPSDNVIFAGEGTQWSSAAPSKGAGAGVTAATADSALPDIFHQPVPDVVSNFLDERAGAKAGTSESTPKPPSADSASNPVKSTPTPASTDSASTAGPHFEPSSQNTVPQTGETFSSVVNRIASGLTGAAVGGVVGGIPGAVIGTTLVLTGGRATAYPVVGSRNAPDRGDAVDASSSAPRPTADVSAPPLERKTVERFAWNRFAEMGWHGQAVLNGTHNQAAYPLAYLTQAGREQSQSQYQLLKGLHTEYHRNAGVDVGTLRDGGAGDFWKFCAGMFGIALSDAQMPSRWDQSNLNSTTALNDHVNSTWREFWGSRDRTIKQCVFAEPLLKTAYTQAVAAAVPLSGVEGKDLEPCSESYLDAMKGKRLAQDDGLTLQQYATLGKMWRGMCKAAGGAAVDKALAERALDYAACKGELPDTPTKQGAESATETYLRHRDTKAVEHYRRIQEKFIDPINAAQRELGFRKVLESFATRNGYAPGAELQNATVIYEDRPQGTFDIAFRGRNQQAPARDKDYNVRKSIWDIFNSDRAITSLTFRPLNGSGTAVVHKYDIRAEFVNRLRQYESTVKESMPEVLTELVKHALHSDRVSIVDQYYPRTKDANPASRMAMIVHARDDAGRDAYVAVKFDEGFPRESLEIGSTLHEAEKYARDNWADFDGSWEQGDPIHGSPLNNLSDDYSNLTEEVYTEMGGKSRADAREKAVAVRVNTDPLTNFLNRIPGYQCVDAIIQKTRQDKGITEAPDPSLPDDPFLYPTRGASRNMTSDDVGKACVEDIGETALNLGGKAAKAALRKVSSRAARRYDATRKMRFGFKKISDQGTREDAVGPSGARHRHRHHHHPVQPTARDSGRVNQQAWEHGDVSPALLRDRLAELGGDGVVIAEKVYPRGEKLIKLTHDVQMAKEFVRDRTGRLKLNGRLVNVEGYKIWSVPVQKGQSTEPVKMMSYRGKLYKIEEQPDGGRKMTLADQREKAAFARNGKVLAMDEYANTQPLADDLMRPAASKRYDAVPPMGAQETVQLHLGDKHGPVVQFDWSRVQQATLDGGDNNQVMHFWSSRDGSRHHLIELSDGKLISKDPTADQLRQLTSCRRGAARGKRSPGWRCGPAGFAMREQGAWKLVNKGNLEPLIKNILRADPSADESFFAGKVMADVLWRPVHIYHAQNTDAPPTLHKFDTSLGGDPLTTPDNPVRILVKKTGANKVEFWTADAHGKGVERIGNAPKDFALAGFKQIDSNAGADDAQTKLQNRLRSHLSTYSVLNPAYNRNAQWGPETDVDVKRWSDALNVMKQKVREGHVSSSADPSPMLKRMAEAVGDRPIELELRMDTGDVNKYSVDTTLHGKRLTGAPLKIAVDFPEHNQAQVPVQDLRVQVELSSDDRYIYAKLASDPTLKVKVQRDIRDPDVILGQGQTRHDWSVEPLPGQNTPDGRQVYRFQPTGDAPLSVYNPNNPNELYTIRTRNDLGQPTLRMTLRDDQHFVYATVLDFDCPLEIKVRKGVTAEGRVMGQQTYLKTSDFRQVAGTDQWEFVGAAGAQSPSHLTFYRDFDAKPEYSYYDASGAKVKADIQPEDKNPLLQTLYQAKHGARASDAETDTLTRKLETQLEQDANVVAPYMVRLSYGEPMLGSVSGPTMAQKMLGDPHALAHVLKQKMVVKESMRMRDGQETEESHKTVGEGASAGAELKIIHDQATGQASYKLTMTKDENGRNRKIPYQLSGEHPTVEAFFIAKHNRRPTSAELAAEVATLKTRLIDHWDFVRQDFINHHDVNLRNLYAAKLAVLKLRGIAHHSNTLSAMTGYKMIGTNQLMTDDDINAMSRKWTAEGEMFDRTRYAGSLPEPHANKVWRLREIGNFVKQNQYANCVARAYAAINEIRLAGITDVKAKVVSYDGHVFGAVGDGESMIFFDPWNGNVFSWADRKQGAGWYRTPVLNENNSPMLSGPSRSNQPGGHLIEHALGVPYKDRNNAPDFNVDFEIVLRPGDIDVNDVAGPGTGTSTAYTPRVLRDLLDA